MDHSTLVRPSPISVPLPRDSGATDRVSGDQRISGPQDGPRGTPWKRWVLLGLVALIGLTLLGAPYYSASLAERVRSPWHSWLRPSGYVGQTAGMLSLAIFLSLWLYPLRRRFR